MGHRHVSSHSGNRRVVPHNTVFRPQEEVNKIPPMEPPVPLGPACRFLPWQLKS
jgi:hypothetical protein